MRANGSKKYLRNLTAFDWFVIAAGVVVLIALWTGLARAESPHSHWVLGLERADSAGRTLAFDDKESCINAQQHVIDTMPSIVLMSECIEMPLLLIKRELEGEKS